MPLLPAPTGPRAVRFVLSLLLLAALAPAPRAADRDKSSVCFDAWWRQRVAAADDLRKSPDALLFLRQAREMARTAPDPRDIAAALEQLRARPDTDPLVAAEIDAGLLVGDLDRGDEASAATRAARLGIVQRILLAGPFAGGVPDDLAGDLAPDAGKTSRFRRLEAGTAGTFPLDQLLHPASRTSAAAVFYLRVARRTAVAIRYGADDRATVEVDGVTILDPPGRHDAGFDQHAAFVDLVPGWHRVLLRVEQEDGAWSLLARVTAPDGRPLDPSAVAVELPDDVAAAERAIAAGPKPQKATGRTLVAEFERAATSGTALAQARLAQDLAARSLPDRNERRAVALARAAAQMAPGDVDVLWVRALVDNDPARRREALEQVLKLEPTHPATLRRLAGYHLEYGRTDASLEEARRSRTACGDPDPYLEGWEALARDHRAFPAGALARLEQLVERFPHQVALLERVAETARQEGLAGRARKAYDRLLAQDRGNDAARAQYLDLLAEAGDAARMRQVLDEAVRRDPLDMNWRARRTRFLLGQGATEDAVREAASALALAPNSPPLLELQGEALLAGGDDKGALAAWRQALTLGQDPGHLGDRIAALTGADDTFGGEWTVALDEAKAIEARSKVAGDPAVVVLSKTAAYRVRPDGLASRFEQVVMRVRHPEQARSARAISFSYSPSLERATVIAARLVRKDGTVLLAARNDEPLLGDPEIRMWYDTRVLQLVFPRLEEGDLVDVRWRVTDRGPANAIGAGYFGDVWLAGDDTPVLASRLVIEAPKDHPVQYRLNNLPGDPTVRKVPRDGQEVTVVELPPLPAYEGAPFAPAPTARVPYAVLGTSTDWAALGATYARLVRDQAAPGPDVEALVQTITARAAGRREKVRALYDWVIENTRYVALELGIHALKPYDVPSVYRRRFGDCKDKATLLVSMLRLAGIDARVAVVRTRDRGPVDTTVPAFALFDHAIVYVPGEDLWLDGTVQHHALGEVPSPDRNVLALLVDPAGERPSELVRIPEMAPADALTGRVEEITLQPDGGALLGVRITAHGDDAGRERGYFRATDRPALVLANRLRRAHPELSLMGSEFPAVGLDDPEVRYSFRARVERFARQDGNGMSVPLGLAVPGLPVDRPAADRRIPLELPAPFERRLTSRIVLPAGFTAEELPRPEQVDSPWGRVTLDVREGGRGVLDVTVLVSFRGGTVPVEKVPEFAAFVERASQALGGRIILRRS